MNNVIQYDEIKAKVDQIKEACNFLPDVSTKEGYDKSKRVALDVGKVLTSLEKSRKEAKADALEYGRKVDSEAKALKEEIESYMLPHKEAYKELDNLKKEREEKRKQDLSDRVEHLSALPEMLRDSSSEEVLAAMESIKDEECLDFYEFTEQALKARNSSRELLGQMYTTKKKEEADAIELEKLRAIQAEKEQKERDEQIARDAVESARLDIEAKANQEADRLKAEAKEKEDKYKRELKEKAAREADKDNRASVNNAALAGLVSAGLSEDQAKLVVIAIAKGKIPNVTINY